MWEGFGSGFGNQPLSLASPRRQSRGLLNGWRRRVLSAAANALQVCVCADRRGAEALADNYAARTLVLKSASFLPLEQEVARVKEPEPSQRPEKGDSQRARFVAASCQVSSRGGKTLEPGRG